MNTFEWVPGMGADLSALNRMESWLAKPREPMGEAWFMGSSREMYPELLGDLSKLSDDKLRDVLTEIAGGTSAFGPLAEWTTWYYYLLPRLVPRCHEGLLEYVLEYLVTAFITLHPSGDEPEPYPGFRDDALSTLGRAMMDSCCWSNGGIAVGKALHRSNNNPNKIWNWWDASGDFTASMFFCLKYLPPQSVYRWLRSALRISSPHWRAQMIVWLVGARGFLTGEIAWPSELGPESYPRVAWGWSHCLRPELAARREDGLPPVTCLIPEPSGSEALRAVHHHMRTETFLEWLASIHAVPYLESELGDIPLEFERLYLRSS